MFSVTLLWRITVTNIQDVSLVVADAFNTVILEGLAPFIAGTDSLHKFVSHSHKYYGIMRKRAEKMVWTYDKLYFVFTLQYMTEAISYGLPPAPSRGRKQQRRAIDMA